MRWFANASTLKNTFWDFAVRESRKYESTCSKYEGDCLVELALCVILIFLGEPFVLTGFDDGFKFVVSGWTIFLSCYLMCNFMMSSAFMYISWIISHWVMIDMFDLSFFITLSSSKWSIYRWVKNSSTSIGFPSFIFFGIKQAHGISYIFRSVHPCFELSEPILSAHLTSWKIKFNVARDTLPTNCV